MIKDTDHLLKGIFLFIFIISGNYLGELLGCRLIELLDTNILVKHLLGFLTLFITLVISVDLESSLFELFYTSIGLYIIFILSSRTTKYINFTIIGILIISYIIQLYKDRLKRKQEKNIITTFEENHLSYIKYYNYTIIIVLLVLLICGVLIYYGEQKRSYSYSFDLYTFIVGNIDCKNSDNNYNSPSEYMTSIKYIFN